MRARIIWRGLEDGHRGCVGTVGRFATWPAASIGRTEGAPADLQPRVEWSKEPRAGHCLLDRVTCGEFDEEHDAAEWFAGEAAQVIGDLGATDVRWGDAGPIGPKYYQYDDICAIESFDSVLAG